MTTLILDNYDSFTYNLYQYIGELGGNPVVHRNDQLSLNDVAVLAPTHIILSPGPGTPYHERDIGISRALIAYAEEHRVPLLGVCLGHQTLGMHIGATVSRAPEAFHGKASNLRIEQESRLFAGLPSGMPVMRYHSLRVEDDLPRSMRVTARSEKGVIMAMEHESLHLYGVQFHPESIGTPHGKDLLARFLSFVS